LTTHAATPSLRNSAKAQTAPRRRASDDGQAFDRRGAAVLSIEDGMPASRSERISNKRAGSSKRALAVADVFAAVLALALSIQIIGNDLIRLQTLVGLPLVIVVSKVIGLYDRDELLLHKSTVDEVPKLFTLAAVYTLCIDILSRGLVTGQLGRDQVLGMWALFFATVVAGRTLARSFARIRSSEERCIIVGDPVDCDRLAAKLESHSRIKATVVAKLPLTPRRDGEKRWTLDAIASLVAYHGAERLLVAPWTTGHEEILDLVRIAKGVGVNVSVLPGVFEVIGSHVEFDEIDGMTVLGVRRFELTRSSRGVKRALDVAGAALMLLLGAPVFGLVVAAIRLESGGSVFFRQERVGRGGQRFRIWKFRTMVPEAEALKAELAELNETDGLFKIADDPRVTCVGRFLRKTSLDELPQLFNVLRGEMSLVGPRPLVVDEDELVKGWDRRRLHLTPGMTGPWQILGGGRIPLAEMVKIDYLYVTGWSLWNDVKILLRTAGYVVARRSV
jgi:exopolysaccharide biosynthesis polyprenyl glycosylphosphotransferase